MNILTKRDEHPATVTSLDAPAVERRELAPAQGTAQKQMARSRFPSVVSMSG